VTLILQKMFGNNFNIADILKQFGGENNNQFNIMEFIKPFLSGNNKFNFMDILGGNKNTEFNIMELIKPFLLGNNQFNLNDILGGNNNQFSDIFKMFAGKQEEKSEKFVHTYVTCDGCNKNPIVGNRYKCQQCADFDFCSDCFQNNINNYTHNQEHKFEVIEKPRTHGKCGEWRKKHCGEWKNKHCGEWKNKHCGEMKNKHFGEWRSKCEEWKKRFQNGEKIHFHVQCNGCNKRPIIGDRYKCNDCEDFDFCQECYEKLKVNHPKEHSFKIIEPIKRHCHNNNIKEEKLEKKEEELIEEIVLEAKEEKKEEVKVEEKKEKKKRR